jgi:uridine phosphorylase
MSLDRWSKSVRPSSPRWQETPSKVTAVPSLLQPKAPFAPDAILVGDPGRALLLAQELLERPKMCNHARGLWGYHGITPVGRELTIQATGVGAPSAGAVLADLVELGVRRAIRVGTAAGSEDPSDLGKLLLVAEAEATEGSAAAFGVRVGEAVTPDPALLERLAATLGSEARMARIVSVDTVPDPRSAAGSAAAADMQTLAILAKGGDLGIATAAVLAVVETRDREVLDQGPREDAAKRAGRAARDALSP